MQIPFVWWFKLNFSAKPQVLMYSEEVSRYNLMSCARGLYSNSSPFSHNEIDTNMQLNSLPRSMHINADAFMLSDVSWTVYGISDLDCFNVIDNSMLAIIPDLNYQHITHEIPLGAYLGDAHVVKSNKSDNGFYVSSNYKFDPCKLRLEIGKIMLNGHIILKVSPLIKQDKEYNNTRYPLVTQGDVSIKFYFKGHYTVKADK